MIPHRRPVAALMFVALVAVLAAPSALRGAEKRTITETDIFKFTWIADPQISPDAARIAYVQVTVDEKADRYDTSLWIVRSDGAEAPRRLTTGVRDLAPRWSPDGRRIAFLRSGEKDGKPLPPQIHLLSMEGGEARAITDVASGAGAPIWSPDGKTLAFTRATNPDDAKKDAKPSGAADADQKPERKSDVRVITRAVYRSNGPGYLDPTRHTHIWTIPVPGVTDANPTPRAITTGDFDEQNPTWSPDGAFLYFTANRVAEPYYDSPDSDIYRTPAAGGEMTRVISIDGQIGDFALSHDAKRIAFRGSVNGKPVKSYTQSDLFVADNTPGATSKNLTVGYDFDIGGGLTGDQHAPRGSLPSEILWARDDRSLLVVGGEQGRANIKRVDAATGKIEPFTSGDLEVVAYTAADDNARLAVLVSTPLSIGELFTMNGAGGALTQITRVNEPLFSQLNLTPPEEIWYQSFDGKRIQAWVQKPPDFDPSKKYPLILNIHGGPHAAYGWTFDHEFQWMAAKGYVVLYPNPRGSTTYGQDFGNIIQFHYPGDDYKDLMAGVDEVIKRGYIDPQRLGVTGGSGGGVLTNWTIVQTNRFAAAVSQRSIADWTGFWYTADFTLFQPTWFRAAPWQDPADFAARSAITHIEKVTTPLMLIEGESDFRTPPSDGGEQMFRALKFLKKPVVMVRFPDESHELSRSGKPWHRVERLQHIVSWFDKYLQGKRVDTYD